MAADPPKGPQWDQPAQRAALLMAAALATCPQSKRGRSSHPGLPSAHQAADQAAVAVEAALSEVLLALSGAELELAVLAQADARRGIDEQLEAPPS